MTKSLTWSLLRHLFTTPYTPHPQDRSFLDHAQTQEEPRARATVAVLDPVQSEHYFGLALAHRGIQPVFVKIENTSQVPLRLQLVRIDPNYYTALEAAGTCHFSLLKRLSTIGVFGLMYLPFLPLMVFLPLKLITAWRANRRMDDFLQSQAFHLRPIPPGGASEGFVFTPLDLGTKSVHINLHAGGDSLDIITGAVEPGTAEQVGVAFTFSLPVPGIAADYLRRDVAAQLPAGARVACTVQTLAEKLRAMPATTSNHKDSRAGDPVNLVVIGEFATILSAFAARWDESETITLATCWKTARSFLLGSQYRYSPVSPLYLFGRSQDTLSHVLVSARFENLPDFWYPSQLQGDLKKTKRNGEVPEVLKSADAQVTLAQIPFMRLHQDLPKAMRKVGKTIKLTDLIQRMNMGNSPESIRLRIDLPKRQFAIWSAVAGEKSQVIVSANKLELAFYVMCYRSVNGVFQVRRPQKDRPDMDLMKKFLPELLNLCGLPTEEKWVDALEALEKWGELHDPDLPRSVSALGDNKEGAGISQKWFDQRLNTLKTCLMEQLPKSLVDKILPSSEVRGGDYKIQLPVENIILIESGQLADS